MVASTARSCPCRTGTYLRWRMYTAYADEAVPPLDDVIRFASWRRETMERLMVRELGLTVSCEEAQQPAVPHVVVLGGGFGGLYARASPRAPVRVTVVDRRNHHLFQPMLYQVATAGLNPSDIAAPIRSVLREPGTPK